MVLCTKTQQKIYGMNSMIDFMGQMVHLFTNLKETNLKILWDKQETYKSVPACTCGTKQVYLLNKKNHTSFLWI